MPTKDPYGDPMWLQHNKIRLGLHMLRDAPGPKLLLLHGLGDSAPSEVPDDVASWPGAVYALDFTGHGTSTVPVGGGYTAEVLMGDADAALARIGPSTVFGRGLGAYIALLIAGARPSMVRGAILADGPGLAGGPPGPASSTITVPSTTTAPPDPYALMELSREVRPPDYAATYARQALALGGVDPAICVTTAWLPEWLSVVANELGVQRCTTAEALALYAHP
jgi:pimeloyl-ACP methyl ester carboxylesterase